MRPPKAAPSRGEPNGLPHPTRHGPRRPRPAGRTDRHPLPVDARGASGRGPMDAVSEPTRLQARRLRCDPRAGRVARLDRAARSRRRARARPRRDRPAALVGVHGRGAPLGCTQVGVGRGPAVGGVLRPGCAGTVDPREARSSWSLYPASFESGGCYLLRTGARRAPLVVPKRALASSSDEERLRDLLARHTAARLRPRAEA